MADRIAGARGEASRERVRRAFAAPREFASSPLYQALSRTVAAEERLVELASRGRPGQYPTFLFFGAVHHLLLSGADHPLAAFFPSVVGNPAAPAGKASPSLVAFCDAYERELTEIISTRLVQTSHVQRALGLRFGLSAMAAADVRGTVHLIEVGAAAGFNLRFDRYGYTVGGRRFGDPASPLQLAADHYGPGPLADLDALPAVGSVRGVDLNPIDVLDPDARSWLDALVWPENHDQRRLLAAAMDLVADDPPPVLRGDAVDLLPRMARSLPAGEPRLAFHSATRMHIPTDRRAAFDAAVASLGQTGPLWRLSLEDTPVPGTGRHPARPGAALELRTPDGGLRTLAAVDGHLRWIETLG